MHSVHEVLKTGPRFSSPVLPAMEYNPYTQAFENPKFMKYIYYPTIVGRPWYGK
jgi:hypothetical protein